MYMNLFSLETLRRWYAEEIRWASGVSDPRIISAFASIPRELFLSKGPWHFSTGMMTETYQLTPTAEPHHLYHNVMVAIDPEEELNTALPSYMASVMESASIDIGSTVAQIGAGLGYYSAILSHLVGPTGSVFALEANPLLAKQCQRNLASYPNSTCLHADGSTYPFKARSLDVLIVHGAATHVPRRWLESLNEGGRILVPLSYASDEPGQLARITRQRAGFLVEFIQEVFAYPCTGTYNEECAETLREAVEMYGWYTNSELRLDLEKVDDSAWLVTPNYWISMTEDGELHDAPRGLSHLFEGA
jgi:protein-L-isoaspartate(D-aspartate) O-methyltransferase